MWVLNATIRPLYLQEKDAVSFVQKTEWVQERPRWVRKISPPQGYDPWTVEPVANRYTDCDIPTHTLNQYSPVCFREMWTQ